MGALVSDSSDDLYRGGSDQLFFAEKTPAMEVGNARVLQVSSVLWRPLRGSSRRELRWACKPFCCRLPRIFL